MAGSNRRLRWTRITVATVAGLVLVFYIAGGVVFSNMIHADALIPQGPTPDNGVYVTAIDDGTITLTSAEEREDTTRPGRAGLAWEGGYGDLGEILEIEDLDVTRRFASSTGHSPPLCSGPLTGCEQVDIESWTFPTDPADAGLDFDEVSFKTPLGEPGAWRIDAGDGSAWAIHAHGWRASRREALRSLPIYHDSGVTSLVIDYRNDEEAPKDPSGLYRFGRTEWEDVEGAVAYAMDNGAQSVILVGYSTGAALDLAFMEQSDLAENVDAMVFDSPNVDMSETVEYEASKRTIPRTPFPIPASLTSVAMIVADLRWDVGWDEIDYVARAGDIVTVPTLVFHGTEDERVPIDVSRHLRDASPDLIRLVEFENGGHVSSWNVDQDRYAATLTGFLGELRPGG